MLESLAKLRRNGSTYTPVAGSWDPEWDFTAYWHITVAPDGRLTIRPGVPPAWQWAVWPLIFVALSGLVWWKVRPLWIMNDPRTWGLIAMITLFAGVLGYMAYKRWLVGKFAERELEALVIEPDSHFVELPASGLSVDRRLIDRVEMVRYADDLAVRRETFESRPRQHDLVLRVRKDSGEGFSYVLVAKRINQWHVARKLANFLGVPMVHAIFN